MKVEIEALIAVVAEIFRPFFNWRHTSQSTKTDRKTDRQTDQTDNVYKQVLWYAESEGMIFVKIVWILGSVSPYSLKWGKFS